MYYLSLVCTSKKFMKKFEVKVDVQKAVEDMFRGLGLFKRPLTTYNDEVLISFINMSSHIFFSLKLYSLMQCTVPSNHLSLGIYVIIIQFGHIHDGYGI